MGNQIIRSICILALMLGLLAACVCAASAAPGQVAAVVLAWDGSGDFGPQTPGTKTCGWQEAISYCMTAAHLSDVYVKGGGTYNVSETIRFPTTEDFRVFGGDYTMLWTGPADHDMVVIDSIMAGRLDFGNLVYGGTGAALRIKPVYPEPLDGLFGVPPMWTDSQLSVQSIVHQGTSAGGTGVVFDVPSGSSCTQNTFQFGSIRDFATCVSSTGSGGVAFNRFAFGSVRSKFNNSTLFSLSNHFSTCEMTIGMGVDGGATGVKGIDLNGASHLVMDVTTSGGFAPGSDVIFEPSANGNRVNLVCDPSVSDPTTLVTDNSSRVNNRLTWSGGQLPVRTIAVTPGVYTYTQRLCPASVRLIGGTISAVNQVRGGTSVNWGAFRGKIILGVGDQLQVTSSSAPTLWVTPLKTK